MMRRMSVVTVSLLLLWWIMPLSTKAAGNYRNFTVSVYARVYEVRQMGDLKWLELRWNELSRQVGVDKVYLETHRDMVVADRETITRVKKFFEDRGIRVAGGITITVNEMNRFQFPAEVLTQIRNVLLRDFFVRVESPGDVSLFAYDNDTFIVESFRPENVDVRISLDQRYTALQDLITGQALPAQAGGGAPGGGSFGFGTGGGKRNYFPVQIKPHSFRAFSASQRPQ